MKRRSDRGARRYLRFWGPDVTADVDDEMSCHIQCLTDDYVRQGMTPELAHARAMEQFGDIKTARAECMTIGEQQLRRERRADWYEAIYQDLRFAVRSLMKSPAFTIVAVLALGLGIGANAAVFSMVDAAAFRPLPVDKPEELKALFSKQGNSDLSELSYPAIQALRADRGQWKDFAGFAEGPASISTGGDANVIWSNLVTENYFSVLALQPELGRLINAGDARASVAVLSYELWRTQFSSDPNVIGRSITLNGYPFTVIGVAPRKFQTTRLFSYAPAIWVPIGMHEQIRPGTAGILENPDWGAFLVIGRLPVGASQTAGQGTLDRVAKMLSQKYPKTFTDWHLVTFSNRTAINPWLAKPEQIQSIGRIVLLGVALVLLIACADVANLLLARMTVRRGEVALRLALGASRGRLIRQFLTESLLLATLGALAAIPLAALALQASSTMVPATDFPAAYQPMLDTRVLIFNAIVAMGAGLVFGLAPAIRGSRANLAVALRDEGRGSTTAGSRLREGLVVLQIAVSLVILVSAGLFSRSLHRARAADPGFKPDGAIVFTLDPQLARGYDTKRTEALYNELTTRLRALPRVTSVSRATTVPLDGSSSSQTLFAEGTTATRSDGQWSNYNVVGAQYFDAIGTKIMDGRDFQEVDRTGNITPIIVNRALAEKFWPGQSPIGKQLRAGAPDGDLMQVIGLTTTARYQKISESPQPFFSTSLLRDPVPHTTVIIRSDADPAMLFPLVRRTVRALDGTLPVTGLATLRKHISLSYSTHESGAFGATSFGVLALILAAAGLYGVIAYNVEQRRREIGVRVALGASSSDVVRMVVRGGLKLTIVGIVIGIALSFASGKALRGMLFETSPNDPLMIAAVALLLALIALIATAIPAIRVSALDPGLSLRD